MTMHGEPDTSNRLRPVVYAETFGNPSEVWMWRQVHEAGLPVLTHEYRNPDHFPLEAVWVVPKVRARIDRLRALGRLLRGHHGYRLPGATQNAVIERLRAEGTTLIHAHFGPAGLRMLPIARALEVPLVVTFHGYDISMLPEQDPSYRKALTDLFSTAWSIAVSDHVQRRLEGLGCGKLRRLYLGTPIDEPVERPNEATDDPVRILTVARLVSRKGVPDLVEAVRGIDAHVQLHIVGEGEDRENIEARAERDPRIVFHGVCGPREVKRHLAEADIFALNSRTASTGESEGLPVSVLEAMAANLPIVSTRHAGIPEGVAENETGLLVDECDTASLRAAIESLVRDPARRLAMGEAGRHRVEERFELGACTRRLLAFYEEVSNG